MQYVSHKIHWVNIDWFINLIKCSFSRTFSSSEKNIRQQNLLNSLFHLRMYVNCADVLYLSFQFGRSLIYLIFFKLLLTHINSNFVVVVDRCERKFEKQNWKVDVITEKNGWLFMKYFFHSIFKVIDLVRFLVKDNCLFIDGMQKIKHAVGIFWTVFGRFWKEVRSDYFLFCWHVTINIQFEQKLN